MEQKRAIVIARWSDEKGNVYKKYGEIKVYIIEICVVCFLLEIHLTTICLMSRKMC